MVKTRVLVIIAIVLVLLTVVLTVVFLTRNDDGNKVAVISVNGEIIEKIDLSKVAAPYDKEIITEYGKNTLHIEKNSISVSDADCPNRACVASGPARDGIPLVCLPHRLVVTITTEGDVDAVSE